MIRHGRFAAVAAALLILAGVVASGNAEERPGGTLTVPLGTDAILPAEYNGDVRDLPPEYAPRDYFHHWNEFERPWPQRPPPAATQAPSPPPPVRYGPMPSPIQNFAGLAFNTSVTGGQAGAGWPPDTNGDVGPTYYIQAVNDAWGIFDKTTGALVAAFIENQLWSGAGTGTACDNSNQGDPIVVHDAFADRWILTNFAFTSSSSGPFYQCIAVSKSGDPVSGGWWLYAVRTDPGGSGAPPANTFVDYPKFGLWTDCLYMGANGFDVSQVNQPFVGAVFAAFSRNALYNGLALSSTNSSIGFLSDNTVFGNFPAHLLGSGTNSLPPNGTPEYFVAESGTAFAFDVRKFQNGANACGAGSTLGAPVHVTQASYGYPATGPSNNPTTDIVRQPGTTNKLDSLGDELMQRVVYRRIGSAESLWVVHTTCTASANATTGFCPTNTTPTQPQWAQIDVTGGTVQTTPAQQQIYAPDTTLFRWMGSLAVDGQGNMAVGYSVSNGTAPNYPSIAYAGRLVTDPPDQLPQTETTLVAGGAAQTNTCGGAPCHRWGDYSAMTIDPADDCTFWFTSEYYDTTAHGSSGIWQTRIGSFKFPGCVAVGPAAKLAFTVQPNASYASNATITVSVSVEDAAGHVVTTDGSTITLSLNGGTPGATLGGTTTVNAVNGVATFNVTVDKVGTGYALHAVDGSLTAATSTSFAITPGAATKLAFITQPPASSQSGTAFGATVTVQDAAGNTVTGSSASISLTLSGGTPGATLSGTTTLNASNGVATFSGLSVDKVGSGYQLNAASTSLTGATSSAFAITPGAATKLAFTAQPPASSQSGAAFGATVTVQDAAGNTVTGSTASIGLTLSGGTPGATLSGTTTLNASNGVATFSGLSVDKVGSGYQLNAASTGLTGTASSAFAITPGAPAQLVFTAQPQNGTANVNLGAVQVAVQDAAGNVVTSDANTVTMTVASGPGGFDPSSTTTVAFANGIATFSNLILNTAGSYTLQASDAADAGGLITVSN